MVLHDGLGMAKKCKAAFKVWLHTRNRDSSPDVDDVVTTILASKIAEQEEAPDSNSEPNSEPLAPEHTLASNAIANANLASPNHGPRKRADIGAIVFWIEWTYTKV